MSDEYKDLEQVDAANYKYRGIYIHASRDFSRPGSVMWEWFGTVTVQPNDLQERIDKWRELNPDQAKRGTPNHLFAEDKEFKSRNGDKEKALKNIKQQIDEFREEYPE